jgi:serine/threonine protein phosphatase PrpC
VNTKSNVDTAEYPAPGPSPETQPPPPISSRAQVDLAGLSHPGYVRSNNEDHYLVVRFDRSLQTLTTNLPEGRVPKRFEEVGYGMVVADGIGGAAAGEVASQTAITTLVNLVLNTPDWIMRGGAQQIDQVMQRMAERYCRIDAVLSEQGSFDPSLSGMGTTLTLACSIGHDLLLAHIGDSRAYLLRGGQLHQLTRDHTVVQRLVETGCLRREEAATHRLRHVLTRSLGASEGEVEAECHEVSLTDQDQVLLCTDGLTDMAEDAAIRAVLLSAASANEACHALVELALKQGGKDNITVVLARYRFPPERSI